VTAVMVLVEVSVIPKACQIILSVYNYFEEKQNELEFPAKAKKIANDSAG
jgi:hypothetical protein